jgi:excisionase family DNA binding protein
VVRVKAMEILTVDELASVLKMTKRQVYEMTSTRTRTGAMKKNPLPVVRINGNLRFRRVDVEAWLAKLAQEAA